MDIQVARRVGGGCADRGCVPELGFAIADLGAIARVHRAGADAACFGRARRHACPFGESGGRPLGTNWVDEHSSA